MEHGEIFSDLLRGRRRHMLSADDLATLEKSVLDIRSIPARQVLVRAGDPVETSIYLIDGFIARYMDDRNGLRQMVGLHVAGDFVDLHAFPLKRLDHDVVAVTPCRIARVPHAAIQSILESRATLSRMLWFSTLLDAAMHREWIFRLGRLDAMGRVGHFFCEIEAKLRAVGRSDGVRFPVPLTQGDLGEACGMTPVHMNRMLRALREAGMMDFRNGVAEFRDAERLARYCEFDPAYLFMEDGADGNAARA